LFGSRICIFAYVLAWIAFVNWLRLAVCRKKVNGINDLDRIPCDQTYPVNLFPTSELDSPLLPTRPWTSPPIPSIPTSFISFLCVSLNDENPSRSNKASRSDFDDNACASPSLDVISAKDFVVVDSSVLRSLTCVWTADSAVRARSRTSRDEEGR
jgi:hypothetical protein